MKYKFWRELSTEEVREFIDSGILVWVDRHHCWYEKGFQSFPRGQVWTTIQRWDAPSPAEMGLEEELKGIG